MWREGASAVSQNKQGILNVFHFIYRYLSYAIRPVNAVRFSKRITVGDGSIYNFSTYVIRSIRPPKKALTK